MRNHHIEAMLQTQRRRIAQRIFRCLDNSIASFKGKTIGVAVSGGLDSRALLEAIARWPKRHDFDFVVLSVDHGIRVESRSESEAVIARAKALGFEAQVLPIFLGKKRDEATLRGARYDAIWRSLDSNGSSVCCLAHQKDDNAEGVVMDLFGFGGGANGAGMEAIRREKQRTLIRPFLELERSFLHLFLSSLSINDYFIDPTNHDGTSSRQKARQFLRTTANFLHPRPLERLARVAQDRLEELTGYQAPYPLSEIDKNGLIEIEIFEHMSAFILRGALKRGYKAICPDLDPRNAGPGIDAIIKKAKTLGLIQTLGVDRLANSITLREPIRLQFDLPGAKALMTPVMVSLYRNQNDLLVQ